MQIKIFRDVAEARSAELQSLQQHGPGVSVNGLNQFLRSFENKEDQRKLDELLAFLRVFEKRRVAHADGDGAKRSTHVRR